MDRGQEQPARMTSLPFYIANSTQRIVSRSHGTHRSVVKRARVETRIWSSIRDTTSMNTAIPLHNYSGGLIVLPAKAISTSIWNEVRGVHEKRQQLQQQQQTTTEMGMRMGMELGERGGLGGAILTAFLHAEWMNACHWAPPPQGTGKCSAQRLHRDKCSFPRVLAPLVEYRHMSSFRFLNRSTSPYIPKVN